MSANTSQTLGPECVGWTCRAGHRWQDRRDLLSVCPDCGDRGVPAEVEGDATTFAPRAARFAAGTALLPGGAMPDLPGYDVLEELGRGGMGVVYKARQRGLNRLVALKMILPGCRSTARFQVEAKAVAQLRHPAIVQVYEVGSWRPGDGSPDVPFFSMEFCPGGTLEAFLAATPLPPADAARLVAALARAIAHAHAAGVIHRDLKPANVLLARDPGPACDRTQVSGKDTGRPGSLKGSGTGTVPPVEALEPKVADFGLAKLMDEQGQTHTGDVMGTPAYMAPEQAEGKAVGPAADVWALGAILYECLTGHPPFRGSSGMETMLNVLNAEPVPPRRLNPRTPADLDTVCLKCLHKDPRRRYGAAAELADDLERFARGEPIRARPVGTVEYAWRWAGQNRLVTGLFAGISLLAALLALSLAGRWSGPRGVQIVRAEAEHYRGRLADARRDSKLAREDRARLEKLLAEAEATVAREADRKHGPKSARHLAALEAEALTLRRRSELARKTEEGTAHHEERMRQELTFRERELRDIEDALRVRAEEQP
ncbi:MAG: protein kinase domain-containing protein [Gemmataceae bacterium]